MKAFINVGQQYEKLDNADVTLSDMFFAEELANTCDVAEEGLLWAVDQCKKVKAGGIAASIEQLKLFIAKAEEWKQYRKQDGNPCIQHSTLDSSKTELEEAKTRLETAEGIAQKIQQAADRVQNEKDKYSVEYLLRQIESAQEERDGDSSDNEFAKTYLDGFITEALDSVSSVMEHELRTAMASGDLKKICPAIDSAEKLQKGVETRVKMSSSNSDLDAQIQKANKIAGQFCNSGKLAYGYEEGCPPLDDEAITKKFDQILGNTGWRNGGGWSVSGKMEALHDYLYKCVFMMGIWWSDDLMAGYERATKMILQIDGWQEAVVLQKVKQLVPPGLGVHAKEG